MKKILLLALALAGCANNPLEICQNGYISCDPTEQPSPPELPPECTDVTQAQYCPQGREMQMCQHAEWAGNHWAFQPRWDCSMSGLMGNSSTDIYTAVCVPSCPGFRPHPTCGTLPGRALKWSHGGSDNYFTTSLANVQHILIPGELDQSNCYYPDARIEDSQYGSFHGSLFIPLYGNPTFVGYLQDWWTTYSPVVVSY